MCLRFDEIFRIVFIWILVGKSEIFLHSWGFGRARGFEHTRNSWHWRILLSLRFDEIFSYSFHLNFGGKFLNILAFLTIWARSGISAHAQQLTLMLKLHFDEIFRLVLIWILARKFEIFLHYRGFGRAWRLERTRGLERARSSWH